MSIKKSSLIYALATLSAACFSVQDKPKQDKSQQDRSKQNKAKQEIKVELRFTVKEFDPKKPEEGSLECVVLNNTDSPIEVPTGYAYWFDSDVVVFGRVGKEMLKEVHAYWDLRLVRGPGDLEQGVKNTTATVKPGKELVVFKETLNALLLPDRKKYDWSWQA